MLGATRRGHVAADAPSRGELSHIAMRRRITTLALGVIAVAMLAGCSGSTPGPSPVGFGTARPTRHGVAAQPFNVGVAVPGAPDPRNAQFLADQQNLYDTSQFGDSEFYQTGYHWRIDSGIGPHRITHADAVFDSQSQVWAVDITFTPAAAAHFGADTQAAFQAGQGTPLNRIAFFVGNRVVSAPSVQSPSSGNTEISGGFTQQQAMDVAAAISAASNG